MYAAFVFFSLIVFLEGVIKITEAHSPEFLSSTITPELTTTQQTTVNVSAVQPQTTQKPATPESSTARQSLPEFSTTTRITPEWNTTEIGTPEWSTTTIGSPDLNTITTETPDFNTTRKYSSITTKYTRNNDTTNDLPKSLGNSTTANNNSNSKDTANKTNSTADRVNETAPNKARTVAPSTGEPKWKVILITALVVTIGFCCVIVVKHMFRTWRGSELPRNYEVQYLVLDNNDEIPLTRPVNNYS